MLSGIGDVILARVPPVLSNKTVISTLVPVIENTSPSAKINGFDGETILTGDPTTSASTLFTVPEAVEDE
jgi:hypothetical protein